MNVWRLNGRYNVTNPANIVNLDMIPSIQFRAENSHLFQRLH
jgi:hypothetical protein